MFHEPEYKLLGSDVKDQELLELIKQLVELDKEIQERLEDIKKLMKHDGYQLEDRKEHYIQ